MPSPEYDQDNIELHSLPESVEAYSQYVEEGLEDDEATAVARYFSKAGARVLDLGCGAGRTTLPLKNLGFSVIGVDVSKPMVHEARSRVSNTPFLTADAASLAFEDETFDYVIFSYNGLDLLRPEKKRHEALQEIYRVLKPGGIFVFSSRNTWGLPSLLSSFSWRTVPQLVFTLGYRLVSGTLTKHYREAEVGIRTGDWDAEGISYFINPEEQKRQLRDHGFELIDTIGRYFGYNLHYVAWKPA